MSLDNEWRDGEYPTDAALRRIEQWPTAKWRDLLAFVRSVWWAPEWGWHEAYDEHGAQVYHLSTGGWSGNEDVIGALRAHRPFWMSCWQETRRGGHFVFEVRE